MDELLQDLRFLLRNKRSTGIAILCIATGIAMTTTTFSGVSPWILKPLPWEDPDRIVSLSEVRRAQPEGRVRVSGPNYRDWQRLSRSFSEMAAFERANYSFDADEGPERVLGARITASTFPLFREVPILGRTFSAEDDSPGRNDVVILSHRFWAERYGLDPGAIGRRLRIDGRPHLVIGVMREGFRFPEWGDAWTPLALPASGSGRDLRRLDVVARMRPGVSIEQVQSEMDQVSRRLEERFPVEDAGWGALVLSYHEELTPAGIQLGLSIQLFASLFVLLIACANAANVLLAQAESRHKEIALRSALGATRSRIIRQMLTESTGIAFVAGALGALAAPPLTGLMLAQVPIEPPYWVEMGMDGWVLGFTVAVCALTGIAFGLVPALRASRVDLMGALKEGGRSATRSVRGSRVAQVLVTAELGLAIVLLVGATLLIRSYLALSEVDLGYDRDGVLTWQVTLSPNQYPTAERRSRFVREAVRRVEAIPGVEAAGAVNRLPAGDGYEVRAFEVEGQPVAHAERPNVTHYAVTQGYLDTLRIDVVDGRGLRAEEIENAGEVVLVSQSLATRFWPGESALGRRIRFEPDAPWLRVVGVTRDMSRPFDVVGIGEAPKWQVWVPLSLRVPENVAFALRIWDEPEAMAPAVRREFKALDPSLPVFAMLVMDEVLLQETWISRMWGVMFGSFAVFALLLSSVGLYGVISYGVAQRRHEVGVRMALGAQRRDVLELVMRQGVRAAATGAVVGLVLSVALGWVLSSLLFGVETRDPLTFLGTTALLTGVALLATFVPALRATRVDPVIALRSG